MHSLSRLLAVTIGAMLLPAAGVVLAAPAEDGLRPADPRPLIARPAATAGGVMIEAYFQYFDGLTMQEAEDLVGWTAGFDFTVPLTRAMQLRFLLPLRTEAEGVFLANGEKTDIRGWGGTFDFATLYFEHQFVGVSEGRNRMSWFLGYGNRTGVLETDTPDKYNHTGRSLHGGLRFDRQLDGGGAVFLDGELRSYEESDDLKPEDPDDDRFLLGTVTAAWLGDRRGGLTPGLEITVEVAGDYFAAAMVPQLILSAGRSLDVKLGMPVGITGDAPDWGAEFRLTFSL